MLNQNKNKSFIVFMALSLILILALAACSGQQTTSSSSSSGSQSGTGSTDVSYTNDVAPILDSRCASCHGGQRTESGFNLTNYASLMKGGRRGAAIVPDNSSGSLLVKLISSGQMPQRGPAVTPAQLQTISNWIDQGAKDN